MLYLYNQKALFIAVPKTGSDAVTKFLKENVPNTYVSNGGKHWNKWMYPEVNPKYTFAFVREPVAWYRSYYKFVRKFYIDVYGSYPKWEEGKFHIMRRWESYDYTSFRSMVESVYADEPSYYTRMVEYFTGPENGRMLDFIGKQENLTAGLCQVLREIGLGHLVNKCEQAMPRINVSGSEFEIDKDLVDLIQQQEKPIYRRFGYVLE